MSLFPLAASCRKQSARCRAWPWSCPITAERDPGPSSVGWWQEQGGKEGIPQAKRGRKWDEWAAGRRGWRGHQPRGRARNWLMRHRPWGDAVLLRGQGNILRMKEFLPLLIPPALQPIDSLPARSTIPLLPVSTLLSNMFCDTPNSPTTPLLQEKAIQPIEFIPAHKHPQSPLILPTRPFSRIFYFSPL